DLGSFRVEATVSDLHAAQLVAGLPVRVKTDGQDLPGRVANIQPAIENGTVRFTVDLADPGDARLRDHLRVDVFVLIAEKAAEKRSVLRLAKGPYARDGAAERVFVVLGDRAVRREVRFGAEGEDCFEVLSGLAPGDEVIVSDLKDYMDLTQIKLR